MNKIKIFLKKSIIGCSKKQRSIIKSLGLKKINSFVIHKNNSSINGMIKKINFLLYVKYL